MVGPVMIPVVLEEKAGAWYLTSNNFNRYGVPLSPRQHLIAISGDTGWNIYQNKKTGWLAGWAQIR
jgi:hypothetical protein